MTPPFAHSQPGRRPITLIASGLAAGLFWLAWVNGAPLLAWVILGITGSALAFLVVANPVNGIWMDDDTLTITQNFRTTRIPLADIAHVTIMPDSEGVDDVQLTLQDGSTRPVLTVAMPPPDVLQAAFITRNIPCTIRNSSARNR